MNSILSAMSVLMIFLGIFVDLLYRESERLLQQPKPTKDENVRRKTLMVSLRVLLYFKAAPLTAILLMASYILLPTTIEILSSSKFSLTRFDELNTIYILINSAIFVLFIISLFITISVGSKYKNIK